MTRLGLVPCVCKEPCVDIQVGVRRMAAPRSHGFGLVIMSCLVSRAKAPSPGAGLWALGVSHGDRLACQGCCPLLSGARRLPVVGPVSGLLLPAGLRCPGPPCSPVHSTELSPQGTGRGGRSAQPRLRGPQGAGGRPSGPQPRGRVSPRVAASLQEWGHIRRLLPVTGRPWSPPSAWGACLRVPGFVGRPQAGAGRTHGRDRRLLEEGTLPSSPGREMRARLERGQRGQRAWCGSRSSEPVGAAGRWELGPQVQWRVVSGGEGADRLPPWLQCGQPARRNGRRERRRTNHCGHLGRT